MPEGPMFSDEAVGSAVTSCRRAGRKKGKAWDIPCVLNILCKKDKAVVDAARTTQRLSKVRRIYFEDPYFDGTQWTTKHFEAGGTAGGGDILFVSGTSCEEAAITLYHEVWHTKQPPAMGWPHPAEDDAYYNTELWTIQNGLPSQARPPLRTTDANGRVVPDRAAITRHVDQAYPVASGPPGWEIRAFKKGPPPQTKWVNAANGTIAWKASVAGDTMAGPQQTDGATTSIPPASMSCP